MSTEAAKREAEALITKFKFERVLNQDEGGKRITLHGHVEAQAALLILERAPFPDAPGYLSALPVNVRGLTNLGNNDIYFWFLGSGGNSASASDSSSKDDQVAAPDFKMSLIWPCTDKHIKKHSKQGFRAVTETPAIYKERVRPFMQANREEGRLNWVHNIIEGRTEVEDVIYRTPLAKPRADGKDEEDNEGFLLLPNLHWDRRTLEALHLLGIVERRDLWSLRDLRKRHVPWLRHMRTKMIDATTRTYPQIEEDQLKVFVHYQPTYYHFHIHVVHVMLEPTGTQSVGKAVELGSIIEQLETMAGDENTGMDTVTLNYTVGEESDLWKDVFEPAKRGRKTSTLDS